jgi:hypothetical protein
MALIAAKEHEHEVHKLSSDPQEFMETAVHKWMKIANVVAKTGCSVYPRGAAACRDKWQTVLGDYKKIFDYKGRTRSNKDYFKMASKCRKELGLPPNFYNLQYLDMECFLSQHPCLNPSTSGAH